MKNSENTSEWREKRQREFMAYIAPLCPHIERYVLALEGDRDRGLDLMGETLLRAWEHFDRIHDRKALLSWCFTTARRLHRETGRRERIYHQERSSYVETLLAQTPSPDLAPDVQALYAALARLPAKQREAIVLFELNGFSLREVQEIQGGSLSALKVRLHRGRKRLGELLGSEEEKREEKASITHPGEEKEQDHSQATCNTILTQP